MSTEVAALDASSDRPAPPAPKGRLVGKVLRRLVVGLAVLALVLIGPGVGARYWVKTPSGRAAIVRLANGLKLGPVGRLQIEGLSGDPLDVFGLRLLRIVDANGAWLEARNVTLAWNPVEILARRVHLRRLQIGLLQVHRAPQQTKEPAQPPSKPPISLILNDAQVRIETDPALSVQHGLWDLKGRVELHRSGRILANMSARSLLHPGDGADLALRIGKRQRFLLRADAVESQGGALSGVLGLAADQPLHVHAVGDGKSDAGGASLIATSGAATPIQGQARWSKAGLSLNGQIALSASRLTRYFAERLGPAAHVKVQAHQTRGDLYALQGQADAANGVLKIDGPVDWRSRTSAALKVDLLVRDVSKWLPQPKIGSAHTIGMVSGGIDRFVYKGDIEGADLSQSGYALSRARGPVELDLKDREWRAKVDLAGAGGAGKGMPATLIGAGPHLKADALLAEGRPCAHPQSRPRWSEPEALGARRAGAVRGSVFQGIAGHPQRDGAASRGEGRARRHLGCGRGPERQGVGLRLRRQGRQVSERPRRPRSFPGAAAAPRRQGRLRLGRAEYRLGEAGRRGA